MIKQNFAKTLKKLDIFAKPVELLIKKQEGYSTLAGAFLTLGIFTILGVILFNQLVQLFNREKPSSFFNSIYTDAPELVHLMGHNFTVQFDFQDENFISYVDTSIYQVSAYMVHKYSITDENGNTTVNFDSEPLPVKICTVDNYLQKDIAEFFIAFDPSKQYCIDWSKIDYVPLRGQFSNSDFRYVELRLSLCQDESCPDINFVRQQTKTNYFSLQISTTNVDLKDPYAPHKSNMKDTFTTVSSQFFKQLDVYFRYVITETDFGLFGSDIVQQKDIAFSRTEERILLGDQNILMQVLIRLDTSQSYNFRQYAKIQEIFGQLGGIWQVLFTFTLLIFTPLRNLSYKIQIINSLFNFEQISQTQQDSSINRERVSHIFSQGIQSARSNTSNKRLSSPVKLQTQAQGSSRSIGQQMKSLKEISKGLKQYFSISKKKLRLFKSEYIIFCCHCDMNPFRDKSRTKIIQDQVSFSSSRIQKSLDILYTIFFIFRYLIKKLNEIDKLKMLILNRDQLNLFDYLPKPTISINPYAVENLNQHHKYFSILKKEKSDYQSTLDAQKSYLKIKSNINDPINIKLIECMGQQFQDLFDFDQDDEIMNQKLSRSENYQEDVEENNPERVFNNSIQVLRTINQTDNQHLRSQ